MGLLTGVCSMPSPAELTTSSQAVLTRILVAPAPAVYKESPTQFKETDGWKVAQPSDAMLRGKWWEIFKDPELNALEEQLNIDNQNIKQFFENFMAARAIVREARAQYFPSAVTVPSYSRSA